MYTHIYIYIYLYVYTHTHTNSGLFYLFWAYNLTLGPSHAFQPQDPFEIGVDLANGMCLDAVGSIHWKRFS